jgi:hypothetical protein
MRALARKQHAHRPAIADRRFLIDDLALPRAHHNDPAPRQPAAAFREPERFRVQRGGRIKLSRRLRGGGHGLLPFVFVIPGRDVVASPESITTIVSMDSQMRNCAS